MVVFVEVAVEAASVDSSKVVRVGKSGGGVGGGDGDGRVRGVRGQVSTVTRRLPLLLLLLHASMTPCAAAAAATMAIAITNDASEEEERVMEVIVCRVCDFCRRRLC